MGWDYDQCVEYVKKNAGPALRPGLLAPLSRPYGPKFANVSISYYSMPDWLAIFELGPKYVGPRRFDAVAHEYKFVGEKFQGKVAALLDAIAGTGSGAALLREIAAAGRRSLRIMPHWHWKQTLMSGPRNSSPRPLYPGNKLAGVVMGTRPNLADAYARRAPVLDENRNPTGEVGTGRGASVVLFYSPEDWEFKDGTDGPGFEPDEVLFHELVHVTRDLRGVRTQRPVDGAGDFGNEEEYLATVIANLYLSEKGKALRGVYSDQSSPPRRVEIEGRTRLWVVAPPPKGWSTLKDPDTWYAHPGKVSVTPRELMGRLEGAQGDFYRALRDLPDGKPKFNPIKQHHREGLRIDI